MPIFPQSTFVGEDTVFPEEVMAHSLQWNSSAVISNPSSRLFRGRQDVTSQMTGSDSAAGNVQTSKTFTIPWAFSGATLILMFKATMEGQDFVKWIKLRVAQLPRR